MNPVTFQHRDGIAHVCLSRPEKHNAFDDQMVNEMTEIFIMAKNNPDIRILILASKGPNFCAGADLQWMKRMATFSQQENNDDAMALANMLKALNHIPKPTIAQIHGSVYGGGVGLVACCDIAIAADNTQFCLSEVRLGLSPATIAPYVIKAIGARQARRYFLTAEKFSAQKAMALNLVHEVCPADQISHTIDRVTEKLLAGGPQALGIAKQLVQNIDCYSTENLPQMTADIIANQRTSQEAKQGLQSFFDRRKPPWVPTRSS